MRNYRSIFRCCMGISIFLFIVLLMMHVKGVDSSQEGSFWANIILGVFGSFLVAAATAFMSYWVERKGTLESFLRNTKKILHSLRKYDFEWDKDKKIQFLKEFIEEDREAWDAAYTDICFISEGRTPNSDHVYIYEGIYKPIQDLVMMVDSFVNEVKVADKGILKDLNVEERIRDIEDSLAHHEEYDTEFEKGKITHCDFRWDHLTVRVQEELGGRYYRIMHPFQKAGTD